MTPKVTGTRSEFDDHDCCTGLAYAATRHMDRVVTTLLENIIAVNNQTEWRVSVSQPTKLRHSPPLTRAPLR